MGDSDKTERVEEHRLETMVRRRQVLGLTL